MKKVLEDLYFGEIQPNISNYDENSRLKMIEQVVEENEELFLELMNAQGEVEANIAFENFAYGFKLGARIILESVVEL